MKIDTNGRRLGSMFNAGMACVKLCDLPDNMLSYFIADGVLWCAATQWGDHTIVGNKAREDLIAELNKREQIPLHKPTT